ncbi:MAG TPA: hypothetical protein VM115_11280 [Vicinamibacterales bacterium]|nr:hypothetical protein [Vicinamibacterales bacterium]
MTRLMPLLCLAACLLARPAAAQLPPPLTPRAELSVGLTGMSRGPGKGSERALASLGFHEGYGSRGMTQTGFDGFWKVEIGMSERRSVSVLTTRTANRTSGVGDVPGLGSVQLSTDHVVVTRAVTWSYRPNGWISFGAGPAVHRRRFAIDAPRGPNVGVRSERALGAVAGVNVKWKREHGTFAHALWQYRYAGSFRSDSVAVPLGSLNRAPEQTVQWPATRIPFSHRMIGIGFGVEF